MSQPDYSAKTTKLAIHEILSIISQHGKMSQAGISEATGFSRSTVSLNCDRLLAQGLLKYDTSTSTNKKKNLDLMLNDDVGYVVGIGVGGTNCRVGLFSITCKLLAIRVVPIDLEIGPDATLRQIQNLIDELVKKEKPAGRLLGIGMGIPTPVKYEEGLAYHPAFMPGFHLYNIREFFQKKYICPVFIDNEVNTMALDEYFALGNTKIKTLLCIKIGTGIGAGVVVNGKIFRGENGCAGNLGHIQVEGTSRVCACGKTGCIETVASTRAIIRNAIEKCSEEKTSLLFKEYMRMGNLTIQQIKDCADNGDRIALSVIEEAGRYIGSLLGKITTFLDPGIIIIAGRATILGPNFLYFIRDGVFRQASIWSGMELQVELTKLTETSIASGAARLCISELFDRHLLLESV